jgi:hypothetical protein
MSSVINKSNNADVFGNQTNSNNSNQADNLKESSASSKDIYEFYDKLDQDDLENVSGSAKAKVYLLEILKDKIEILQKRYL